MARVFITGSSDGLVLVAAQLLIEQGHGVVLHARNELVAITVRNALTVIATSSSRAEPTCMT